MKGSGLYPRVLADARGSGVVSPAGGLALVETVRASGVDTALSAGLAWWGRMSSRDPRGDRTRYASLGAAWSGVSLGASAWYGPFLPAVARSAAR